METTVLLNGNFVESNKIDPQKHKFIGTFRTPNPPYVNEGVYFCPCGSHLWHREGIFNHWQMGHMDVPQYVDIN